MGCYDYFEDVQIKAGLCEMKDYKPGDPVDPKVFKDGIYIGYEGIVVIKNSKFVCTVNKAFNKYGSLIDTKDIIDAANPLFKIIEEVKQSIKKDGIKKYTSHTAAWIAFEDNKEIKINEPFVVHGTMHKISLDKDGEFRMFEGS